MVPDVRESNSAKHVLHACLHYIIVRVGPTNKGIAWYCYASFKMVPSKREELNTIFQELADWEEQLKPLSQEVFEELGEPL